VTRPRRWGLSPWALRTSNSAPLSWRADHSEARAGKQGLGLAETDVLGGDAGQVDGVDVARHPAMAATDAASGEEVGLVRQRRRVDQRRGERLPLGLADAQAQQVLRAFPDQLAVADGPLIEREDLPLFMGDQWAGADLDAQLIPDVDALQLLDAVGQVHRAHGGPRVVLGAEERHGQRKSQHLREGDGHTVGAAEAAHPRIAGHVGLFDTHGRPRVGHFR